jgi:hypothetical protein
MKECERGETWKQAIKKRKREETEARNERQESDCER